MEFAKKSDSKTIFGICEKSNSNRGAKQLQLMNWRTKATQIDCISFSRAAKGFGIRQQTQLQLTVFLIHRAAKFFGCANKNNSN
jgi:hypothetical protein